MVEVVRNTSDKGVEKLFRRKLGLEVGHDFNTLEIELKNKGRFTCMSEKAWEKLW